MTSDFSVKGISALAPQGGLFPFSPSCSQGDLPEPRTYIIRSRHFCQSVFGGSVKLGPHVSSYSTILGLACSCCSPGKCMPAVKTPPDSVSDSETELRTDV